MLDVGPDGEGAGPLVVSDLFFGLSAILLVVLALVSFGLRELTLSAMQMSEEDTRTEAAAAALADQGQTVALALAQEVVLLSPGGGIVRVPRDALFGPNGVPAWVAETGVEGAIVVVAADGTETAFLLEPALAQAGLDRIRRVRLTGPCETLDLSDAGMVCGNG